MAGQHRRAQAVDFARASVALEGFGPNPADEELSRRYVAGEISMAEVLQAVHESARQR